MEKKELSVEELVEIAKSEGESTTLNQVELFMKEMNIQAAEPGCTDKVDAAVIYWFYLKWKKARGESDIIARKRFFVGWADRFKRVRFPTRIGKAYRIKADNFQITREEYRQVLRQIREEKEWYARRKRARETRKKMLALTKQNSPK